MLNTCFFVRKWFKLNLHTVNVVDDLSNGKRISFNRVSTKDLGAH